MRSLCIALLVVGGTFVVAEEAAKTTVQKPQVAQPLHRHPTLLSMLRKNNEIRRRIGLRAHRMNPALTKAAQDHANYMARTGDFQHYSNGGPQGRASRYGFRGGARENIAWNYRGVDSAFQAWVTSSGHYASLVSNTSDAGFGYAVANNGATYWVGMYANPAQGDPLGEPEGIVEIEKAAAAKAEAAAKAAATAKADEKAGDKTEEPAEGKIEATPASGKKAADEKPVIST